jgi:hypothetical protein
MAAWRREVRDVNVAIETVAADAVLWPAKTLDQLKKIRDRLDAQIESVEATNKALKERTI